LWEQEFVFNPCVCDETFLEFLQFLEDYPDVQGGTAIKGVVVCDPPDAFHFGVGRCGLHRKLADGILLQLVVQSGRICLALQRSFQEPDVTKQGVFLFVDVFDEIFHKQGEHQLQVFFQMDVVRVVGLERLDKPTDVGQLMLYKQKVRMLQVLDNKVKGIVDQRQLSLLE